MKSRILIITLLLNQAAQADLFHPKLIQLTNELSVISKAEYDVWSFPGGGLKGPKLVTDFIDQRVKYALYWSRGDERSRVQKYGRLVSIVIDQLKEYYPANESNMIRREHFESIFKEMLEQQQPSDLYQDGTLHRLVYPDDVEYRKIFPLSQLPIDPTICDIFVRASAKIYQFPQRVR